MINKQLVEAVCYFTRRVSCLWSRKDASNQCRSFASKNDICGYVPRPYAWFLTTGRIECMYIQTLTASN